MGIRLLNWNVWCENKELDRVVEFLSAHNADIVCLQEVSESLLGKLLELPSHVCVKAHDDYHLEGGKRVPSYLVILTNLRVQNVRNARFRHQPKRSFFARLQGLEEGLEYQYMDTKPKEERAECKEVSLRIFNLHLENAAGPKLRLIRFQEVLRSLGKNKKNIICGDLNIFRAWYSWSWRLLLGCSWDELWMREYEVFAKMFAASGFANVFNGAVTHAWSGNQLDYILVPRGIKVLSHTLFEDTFGSDHKPILVEISL